MLGGEEAAAAARDHAEAMLLEARSPLAPRCSGAGTTTRLRWSPLVRRGGVLAIPTESSYALAVDPTASAPSRPCSG